MPSAFHVELLETSGGGREVRLDGRLTLADAGPLWAELRRLAAGAARGQALDFELSAVERIDGGAMALLAWLRAELHRRGVACEFRAAGPQVQGIVHLYGGDLEVARLGRRRPRGTLDQLGAATLAVLLTVRALQPWDVGSGLAKSVVFGLAIALIACQQGLATRGGAEAVGRRTTSAVVVTLFTLILVDAIASVLFSVAGL